jgi:hypothetical protein
MIFQSEKLKRMHAKVPKSMRVVFNGYKAIPKCQKNSDQILILLN